jgi:hypothetical protein
VSFPAPRTVSRSAEERRTGRRDQEGRGNGKGEGGGGLSTDFTRASPFRGESFSEEEGEGPWDEDEESGGGGGGGRREPTRAERRLEGASGVGFVLKWMMAPMLIIGMCFISSSSLPGNEAARKKVNSDSLPGALPRAQQKRVNVKRVRVCAKEASHHRSLFCQIHWSFSPFLRKMARRGS